MVTELVNECMDYGIVTQLKQHVVLERLHSTYLPPKQPLIDFGGRPATQRASHFRCDAPSQNFAAMEALHTEISVCVLTAQYVFIIAIHAFATLV